MKGNKYRFTMYSKIPIEKKVQVLEMIFGLGRSKARVCRHLKISDFMVRRVIKEYKTNKNALRLIATVESKV